MATKSKRRDPAIASEWPVNEYPYMIRRPHEPHPRYFKTFKDAINKMVDDIEKFRARFAPLGHQDTLDACDRAIQTARALGMDGGSVNQMVEPHTQMWYRAELIKRQEMS